MQLVVALRVALVSSGVITRVRLLHLHAAVDAVLVPVKVHLVNALVAALLTVVGRAQAAPLAVHSIQVVSKAEFVAEHLVAVRTLFRLTVSSLVEPSDVFSKPPFASITCFIESHHGATCDGASYCPDIQWSNHKGDTLTPSHRRGRRSGAVQSSPC